MKEAIKSVKDLKVYQLAYQKKEKGRHSERSEESNERK